MTATEPQTRVPGPERQRGTGSNWAAGLADRATDLGFAAGWSLVKAMPEPVVTRTARLAADIAYRRRGPAVRQYTRNLARVLRARAFIAGGSVPDPGAPDAEELAAALPPDPDELEDLVRRGLRSYARYWKETFRLPAMDLGEVYEAATAGTTGFENIDKAISVGRGVVLALPHSGNWDVAGLFVRRRWGSLTTVAERLRPESVYERFVAYRESLGMEILPLTGGSPPSEVLKARLRAGGIIALLADRDMSAGGVPVTFFGEATRMPPGPAMLAAVTGAALIPIHLSYTETGWRQILDPPLDLPGARLAERVRTGTQRLADVFAGHIAEYPSDWHMLQPLWTADQADRGRRSP